MKAKDRIAQLETELETERRHTNALAEWFICSHRWAPECYPIEGTGLELRVLGLSRASGGVVSVMSSDYADLPRYVDDLVSEWMCDSSPEIREAARMLRKLQRAATIVA